MFPTPSVAIAEGGQKSRSGARVGELLLGGIAEAVMPTPSTSNRDGNHRNGRGELLLPGVAEKILPTPVVTDSESARNSTAGGYRDPGHMGDTLLDALTHLGLADPGSVLPTPTTEPNTGNGHARDLGREVAELLPTPAAGLPNDGEDRATWQARHDKHAAKGKDATRSGIPLPIAVQESAEQGPEDATADGETVRWGKYRAAILRAQRALGRLAPSPTRPDGKGGKRRLSPPFVEWMMGLRAGHVTAVPGIIRRDQLKLLGNGVVPAQASAASLILLGRVAQRLRERSAA